MCIYIYIFKYSLKLTFSSSLFLKMIPIIFSLPNIYNNYTAVLPFTNGFAFVGQPWLENKIENSRIF